MGQVIYGTDPVTHCVPCRGFSGDGLIIIENE